MWPRSLRLGWPPGGRIAGRTRSRGRDYGSRGPLAASYSDRVKASDRYVIDAKLLDGEPDAALAAATGRIVLGDCISVLRRLPDDSIDLIHTSPPYNIDKGYRASFRDRRAVESYADFLAAVIAEMRRVLKPNGALYWQTGYTDAPGSVAGDIEPIDHLSAPIFREEPNGLILWDRIIWRYFGGMAFKRKFTNRHETILWFVKPLEGAANPTFNLEEVRERSRELDKRNNFWGRNPGNVWEVDRVAFGSTEGTSHIAVYPEEIAEKIVRASTNPGDLVLDPFAGSGTTPKVAHSLGRRWIGIELSDMYAAESASRIGFQQPSELLALASGITKVKVFGSQRGTRSADEILQGLREWCRNFDAAAHRSRYERLTSQVFPDGPDGAESKSAKPDVWARFDRMLSAGREDGIVEVDQLLMRDYRNRRNLNGPHRYRSALRLAEELIGVVLGDRADEFVGRMLNGEPSSYLIDSSGVHLLQTAKLSKTVGDGWSEFLESLRSDEGIAAAPAATIERWAEFARAKAGETLTEDQYADLLDDSAMFGETRRLADEIGSDLFWRVRDEVTREFGSVQKLGRRQVFGLVLRALDELAAAVDPAADEAERADPAVAGHDGTDL